MAFITNALYKIVSKSSSANKATLENLNKLPNFYVYVPSGPGRSQNKSPLIVTLLLSIHTSLSPPKLAPDKNPSLSAKFANPIPRARPRVVKKTWSFILQRHKLLSVRYGSPQGPTNSHTSGEDADSTEPNPNPSHKLKARTGAKQLSSIGVEATTYTRLPPREDFSLPSLDSSSLEFSSEVKLSESNRA
ncbi:unnamed protein product [Prunus armeniaca]